MDRDDVKKALQDIGSSLLGVLVVVQTVYPQATGESIIAAFQDGSWIARAINIAFAYVLIRYKGAK